jgi:hypothetical protein
VAPTRISTVVSSLMGMAMSSARQCSSRGLSKTPRGSQAAHSTKSEHPLLPRFARTAAGIAAGPTCQASRQGYLRRYASWT